MQIRGLLFVMKNTPNDMFGLKQTAEPDVWTLITVLGLTRKQSACSAKGCLITVLIVPCVFNYSVNPNNEMHFVTVKPRIPASQYANHEIPRFTFQLG